MPYCSKCEKEIAEGSFFCNYCGERVDEAASMKRTTPNILKQEKKDNSINMANFIVILFWAILILIIFSIIIRPTSNTSTPTNNEINQIENESLTEVSAYELALAYNQNTIAADQRFKGKRFKVTGTVVDINTDFLGNPYVVLSGGVNQFSNPQFEFDKEQANRLANLRKGWQVVLVCTGKGDIAKTPMSDSCIFSQ